jgi:dipeptidyl aminopeptidase/acylaminoacyl peptidase
MLNRSIYSALLVLLALAIPATASAASSRTGAVVFSQAKSEEGGEAKGGLYAAKEGHLNQLTENAEDSEPDFSADGRKIAFVRSGDVWAMRADGTGQHKLTAGSEVDSRPQFSPDAHYVVFERRAAAEGSPRDLYRVNLGGSARPVAAGAYDEHGASFSPDGRAIVFVRSIPETGGGFADNIYSVRPSGAGLARLTSTGHIDEFSPRYFKGGIVFSRGQSGEGPGAYADIFTMRRNGSKVRVQVAGAGSSFVEDVAPGAQLLLFRRDQGLWVKKIGPQRAHKLSQVADNSSTNSVFSSDGRRVAAFIATEEAETLSAIDVASRRSADLAQGFSLESGSVASSIGPVITWQPVPR